MLSDVQYSKSNPPISEASWLLMPRCKAETLHRIGCRLWSLHGEEYHWIYPAEWYEHIPAGLLITHLDRKQEWFEPNRTPKGDLPYLSFGFLQLKEFQRV
jgi:hypothetical protein